MDFHTQHTLEDRPYGKDWDSAPNLVRTDKDLVVKDKFNVTEAETQQLHGEKVNRTPATSVYKVLLTDYLIAITNLGVAPTITLPPTNLAGIGKIYVVKDEAGGAATTTITVRPTFTAEGIDGAASFSITGNFNSISLYCNGGSWFVY